MKKGFTLIELLVVITIIAILAGAALPYVQNYVDESRQAKAKSDLDEIARALIVYESREGAYDKTTVEDLTGRYLDRSPIDPWGVPYVVATESGIVYSLGPDRKDAVDGDEFAFDNIEVSYIPPLALVSVKWVDKNKSGAVDTQNVQDELHLTFSRRLATPTDLLGDLEESVLKNLMISRDPNDLAASEALTVIVDPGVTAKIVGGDKTIVLPLRNDPTENPTNGVKYFIAGQDKIAVRGGHGKIKDTAKPNPNDCISDQRVVILPQ